MQLKKSRHTAEEEIIGLINEGYALRQSIQQDHDAKKAKGLYVPYDDNSVYFEKLSAWRQKCADALVSIFPTEFEAHSFAHTPATANNLAVHFVGIDQGFGKVRSWIEQCIEALTNIRSNDLGKYVDANYHDITEGADSMPDSIRSSLPRFEKDNPDKYKCAFIMMRFSNTKLHADIDNAIKGTLKKNGLIGFRADDKEYHADLFPNVLTYMHGCGFGIAVYERIEAEEYNPNIALEVGYMLGLSKPVCLLKDRTLRVLHADLAEKLYKPFDTQNVDNTISTELGKWLVDHGFATS